MKALAYSSQPHSVVRILRLAPLSPTPRKGKLDFVSHRHGAVLHLSNAFGHGIKGINEDVYCLLRNVRSLQNRGEMLQFGNPLTVKLSSFIGNRHSGDDLSASSAS